MRHRPSSGLFLLLGASLASLVACRSSRQGPQDCSRDEDCGVPARAYRCEAETRSCTCRTDEACPSAQLCNSLGFCQNRSGCQVNDDCLDPMLFCDTGTGSCLPRGRCTHDLQCDLGQVCDTTRSRCLTGCRRHGDCPGTSCRCGDLPCTCVGTTPEELARCQLGVCDPSFCADQSFCSFGEVCGPLPDAGDARARCSSDFDIDLRPYCARCNSGGGIETCGTGANFCIIDTRTASTYCGADCSDGQQCPRGYACRDIRRVFTRWQCDANTPCPADPNVPCFTDADCRRGGTCIKPVGQDSGACAGQCRIREGSGFGYCSCQVDDDCPQQSCSAGRCSLTKKPCVVGADCRPIRCVDFEGVGACHIGQNCTPANGLTCVEVR